MHNDTNTVSTAEVTTTQDDSNIYLTLKFSEYDKVYTYYDGEYNEITELLQNNSLTAEYPINSSIDGKINMRLVKNGKSRYITITYTISMDKITVSPVQYTNTPFS